MNGTKLLITVIAVSTLTACGGRAVTTGDGPDQLVGRTFVSTKVTENGKAKELAPGTTVSFQFTDDGRLNVRGGCNGLSGKVDAAGGHLTVDNPTSTLMACTQPGLDAQEKWLARLISQKPAWQLTGDALVVSTSTTRIEMADRRQADPDKPLAGPRWTVDTIISGTVASSTPAARKAFLSFKDGKVSGNSGCNGFGGEAKIDGRTIHFGNGPIHTEIACSDDIMKVERGVFAVLRGDVTYKIESDKLTLTGQGGAGLQLTATDVTPSPTK
ncbi:META domain-containing protein [Fodinicola acaciae]|uniref:META domain-containing protein n=1 Tax=Fodinicola acaciae TaxID=2681555 RepID=UPI0013CFCCB6|nr:META domain-containing protein [Fodinicola acaciae]